MHIHSVHAEILLDKVLKVEDILVLTFLCINESLKKSEKNFVTVLIVRNYYYFSLFQGRLIS